MSSILEKLEMSYADQDLFKRPDGVKIYWENFGTGPNLTIVNNFFIISPLWRNFTRSLSEKNSILTYDLRNQGASTPAVEELTYESHIDDLLNLLDALEVEKTYLMGSSTSTLICRDFAIAYPERVKGLILVSPLFCPYGSRRRKYLTKSWLNSLCQGGVKSLFDHIYPLVYSDRAIENGGSPTYLSLRERFLAMNSYEQIRLNLNVSLSTDDNPKKLSKITCPTLLLAGDADFLASRSSLDAICKLIPRARIEILDFAGHIPYFEATTAFEYAVQNLINEIEAEG